MFTSLFFVVLVTRRLSPDEFGLWILLMSLIGYVTVMEPIVNFWSTRQIARGLDVGKSAIVGSGLLSSLGILIYIFIIFFISKPLDVDIYPFLLASIVIPFSFINSSLGAICLGFRPQSNSIGQLVFQIAKVPFGLIFVFILELGVIGVIYTLIFAELIRLIILIYYSKEKLSGLIKTEFLKFSFKNFWLSVFQKSSGLIKNIDILIFTLITGSLSGLAFWGAANAISDKIGQLNVISQGLYPKIISGGKNEFVEKNLEILIYISIPFLCATIIFAKPLLHILNPIYIEATNIVIILSIKSLVTLFSKVSFNILQGYDKVDLDQNVSLKKLLKSKLFFLSTFNHIIAGLYLIIFLIFLLISKSVLEDLEIIEIWAFLYLITTIPLLVYGLWAIYKKHSIKFPISSTLKYSSIGILSSIIVFYMQDNFLVYSSSIWEFLPQVIPLVILGSTIYFGLTYSIDSNSKKLINSILKEFIKK